MERTLFEPLSHNKDPLTSYEAADRHKKSGKWETNKVACYETLKHNQGSTAGEICQLINEPSIDYEETKKRLSDLYREWKIIRTKPHRKCSVKGSNCSRCWTMEYVLERVPQAAKWNRNKIEQEFYGWMLIWHPEKL